MTKSPDRAGVSAPASSANLGPGFDSLGLALDLRDTVRAQVVGSGLEVVVEGEGADVVPRDERHLVVRAMRAAFDVLGGQPSGLELACANRIPHGRGLGSSAAAIVAGVFLARALAPDGAASLPVDAAFRLAADLEGHPDNVAAAVYGGLTIALTDDSGSLAVPAPLSPKVGAVVFLAPKPVSTQRARGLLPDSVPHAVAAQNSARAALLVAALRDRPDLLFAATVDRLHQSYRRPAMPASLDLVEELRAAGYAAVISGAGPSVLVLTTGAPGVGASLGAHVPSGWACLPLKVAGGVRPER